ncbi:MAG TPA: hypothetical protein VFV96_01740 [Verrucomicrobiae bacterium]|nr:hypothetical protein [Verrucomicrobiae bacterium]
MEVYFDNMTAENARLDKLAQEMETLAQSAEELVQNGGAALPEKERQRLAATLAQLKSAASRVKEQAMNGVRATDRVIRAHPYESAGIALALGLLIGALVGRSGRSKD